MLHGAALAGDLPLAGDFPLAGECLLPRDLPLPRSLPPPRKLAPAEGFLGFEVELARDCARCSASGSMYVYGRRTSCGSHSYTGVQECMWYD